MDCIGKMKVEILLEENWNKFNVEIEDEFLLISSVNQDNVSRSEFKTKCFSFSQIQYKHEYYYSGINPVEYRGHKFVSKICQT